MYDNGNILGCMTNKIILNMFISKTKGFSNHRSWQPRHFVGIEQKPTGMMEFYSRDTAVL